MSKSRKKRLKQRSRQLAEERQRRILLLIERGMISDPKDIPEKAIPIDPELSTKARVWPPETYYQDIEFGCEDCGIVECWSAESQQYYFEVMQSLPYKQPKRCYDCRQKEIKRRDEARKAAGHSESDND